MKVAHLAPEHTYSGQVARQEYPDGCMVGKGSIQEVIDAVEDGTADRGVVPIMNPRSGDIIETLDGVVDCYDARIIAERWQLIKHCFAVHPKNKAVNHIHSKSDALKQCVDYTTKNYPNATPVAVASTGASALKIMEEEDLYSAAIASEAAMAGLKILERDIVPNNYTRFVVFGRTRTESTGDDKTFMLFKLENKVGTLAAALSPIARARINISYFQCRNFGGDVFFVEMEAHEDDVGDVIDEIDANSFQFRVAGSYASSEENL